MDENADTDSGTLVTFRDAMRVVQRLVPMSEDIDLWVATLSDQVVHDAEAAVPAEPMIAERLRADLPGMVKLRRGVGLFGVASTT